MLLSRHPGRSVAQTRDPRSGDPLHLDLIRFLGRMDSRLRGNDNNEGNGMLTHIRGSRCGARRQLGNRGSVTLGNDANGCDTIEGSPTRVERSAFLVIPGGA